MLKTTAIAVLQLGAFIILALLALLDFFTRAPARASDVYLAAALLFVLLDRSAE